MKVFLVTASSFPDGEDGGGLLSGAFAERGMQAEWVCWDDAGIKWGSADLVVVRATWDYVDRHAEFLAWARRVEGVTRLLNGSGVFAWNSDKIYLGELADAGADVVPTGAVQTLDDLGAALAAYGSVVVKPRVGAGGVGVRVVTARDVTRVEVPEVPSVVQPLVESVRTAGEMSVYVIGGGATGQVRKRPGPGEVRVHEHLGGRYERVAADLALSTMASEMVALAQRLSGAEIDYARVDFLQWRGRWRVSELELIEPSLYLELLPENAAALAEECRRILVGARGM